jgi:ATP-binding cassette subfamily B protein
MSGGGAGVGGVKVPMRIRKLEVAESTPRVPIRKALKLLLRDRLRSVSILMFASILSGFCESAALAIVVETAATIATGARRTKVHIGPLHVYPQIDTMFEIALALVVIRLLLQIPLSILPPRIASDMQAELRSRLFHAFSRSSWDVQSRDLEGQLQETMTGQVGQATSALLNAMGLLTSSVLLIVLLVSAFALNVLAAAFVLVLTASLIVMLRPLRKAGVRRARALSLAQVKYARGIAEAIRMAEETHVFGAGAAQRKRIGGFVAAARRHTFATQVLLRLAANLYGAVISLLFVGTLAFLYEIGRSHAASLGAVVVILVRASASGQNVQAAYQGLIQAMPFVERTQEAERRYLESGRGEGSQPLSGVRTLVFEGVGYAYRAGRPVLSDVSFGVDGGEVVGVIGPSGAGKSTLVQLLLRLREPDQGRYLVNGIPAGEVLQKDWHSHVAYVPQEPRLLHASVAENIRFFREIDDAAVERAARLARIHEDVVSWPDGYDTLVGPRADAVSGGQQQRICLARALVANPEVLVLDEPTSALDPTSEALIQESLTGLKQQLTLFIVAHRMSTLDICDRVMIIIDGKLVAFDTIEHLRQHNTYYRTASKIAIGDMLPDVDALPDVSPAGL